MDLNEWLDEIIPDEVLLNGQFQHRLLPDLTDIDPDVTFDDLVEDED